MVEAAEEIVRSSTKTKKKAKLKAFAAAPKKKKLDTFAAPAKRKASVKLEEQVKRLRAEQDKAKAEAKPAKRPKARNHAMGQTDSRYSLVLRLPETMRGPLNQVKSEDNVSINTYIFNLLSVALAQR